MRSDLNLQTFELTIFKTENLLHFFSQRIFTPEDLLEELRAIAESVRAVNYFTRGLAY